MNISYALYIYIYIYTRMYSLSGVSMCFHFTCFMIANSLVCTYLHTSICPQTYHTHFYSAKYFSSAVETWLDQYLYVYIYVNEYIYIYIYTYMYIGFVLPVSLSQILVMAFVYVR